MALIPDVGGGDFRQPGFQSLLGPNAVDSQIRQAISLCWMTLPPEKRNVETVCSTIRGIVERALSNLSDDAKLFDPKRGG